jgi:hypothetical protein
MSQPEGEDFNDEDRNNDDEVSVPPIEQANTIETKDLNEVNGWVEEVNKIEVGGGPAYRALILRLPKSNDSMGQGLSCNRLLRAMRTITPVPEGLSTFGNIKSCANLKASQKREYNDIIDRIFSGTEDGSDAEKQMLIIVDNSGQVTDPRKTFLCFGAGF